MATLTIDAKQLAGMFLAGASNLNAKKDFINELNVFPVPDGDTGTNMTMTILSASKAVTSLDEVTFESLAKAISSGSLRGARGNSGVILSQLLRGFTKGFKDLEILDVPSAAVALDMGRDRAYKAVMKPKEGTILTVARGIAEKASELSLETDDFEVFIPGVVSYAEEVLAQTPDLLPVLKEAGVVDSGGQGLLEVIKGAYDAFLGKEIDYSEVVSTDKKASGMTTVLEDADIRFGYCTEFIIMLDKAFDDEDEKDFKAFLTSIGDSIVCVADDGVVKIHVHTNDPGLAIQRALTYGQLTSMKIDNMREEHHERLIKDAEKKAAEQKAADEAKKTAEPKKAMGFVAVSIGSGMNEIFKGLGVDALIEGGQTMNPSTEDMLEAIDKVPAETVFILPNNKNIILAANQAKDLVEDKNIIVLPTKTVPQGLAALVGYMPDAPVEDNKEAMMEEIENVRTGQLTYAVRDTKIDDKVIHEGDIMGIGDSGILTVGQELFTTAMNLADALVDEDTEILTLFRGEDTTEDASEKLFTALEEAYPDIEVEMEYGGQPVYYYVMSAE